MTDARILTADEVSLYWPTRVGSRLDALLDSHVALSAKLAEVEADRADIIARRDQVLDDFRVQLEAEIAARKLVEAKLTVAEADRDEARGHGVFNTRLAKDLLEAALSRAEQAETALAERTKGRDEAIARALASERFRREDAADHLDDQMLHIQRWREAEAALARVREALVRVTARAIYLRTALDVIMTAVRDDEKSEFWTVRAWLTEHGIYHDNLSGLRVVAEMVTRAVSEDDARAALTPAAPEEPKGDPR